MEYYESRGRQTEISSFLSSLIIAFKHALINLTFLKEMLGAASKILITFNIENT